MSEAIRKQIKNAMAAHGKWKLRLRTAVGRGASEFKPENVRPDNLCEFGQWLHGPEIDAQTKQGVPYQVILRLHREFHETAANVLSMVEAGRKDEAEEVFSGEYHQRSDKLIRALAKWDRELLSAATARQAS